MMVKKIGNLYKLLILLNLIFNINADDFKLILKAIDADDVQTSEVAIGVPFLIKLIIESSENFNNLPQVPSIDKFQNGTIKEISSSTTIRTINGVTSIIKTYHYESRIDKEGYYHVGPAKIEINSYQYKSNILKLN